MTQQRLHGRQHFVQLFWRIGMVVQNGRFPKQLNHQLGAAFQKPIQQANGRFVSLIQQGQTGLKGF